MWKFRQLTGELLHNEISIGFGYSGSGLGLNNPSMQAAPNVGPIPRGLWTIGKPYDSETHGPYVMRLTPDLETKIFKRGGFLIHGDSMKLPGTASKGCIVLNRAMRNQISASGDIVLIVTI